MLQRKSGDDLLSILNMPRVRKATTQILAFGTELQSGTALGLLAATSGNRGGGHRRYI
jgi:hypothetical protein